MSDNTKQTLLVYDSNIARWKVVKTFENQKDAEEFVKTSRKIKEGNWQIIPHEDSHEYDHL